MGFRVRLSVRNRVWLRPAMCCVVPIVCYPCAVQLLTHGLAAVVRKHLGLRTEAFLVRNAIILSQSYQVTRFISTMAPAVKIPNE